MSDQFQIMDLSSYFNNDGISYDTNRSDGDFDGHGTTFPAEDLPEAGFFCCYGIDFLFPNKADGQNNNIALEGQTLQIPPGRYEDINILGVAEAGSFQEEVVLQYTDGTYETVNFGLTSWHRSHRLLYGEKVAIKCSGLHTPQTHLHTDKIGVDYGIWLQILKVNPTKILSSIALPDNPCMHIFALTLRLVGNGS